MLQLEGQPADTSDFEGRSALMLACIAGHRDIALALLGAGADPNLKDRDGATPLLKAVRNGHDSTVNLLRSCGAECAPILALPLPYSIDCNACANCPCLHAAHTLLGRYEWSFYA